MSLDDLAKNKGNWLEILMGKADVVKKDVSFTVAAACSLAVTTVAAFNLSEVIEPAA